MSPRLGRDGSELDDDDDAPTIPAPRPSTPEPKPQPCDDPVCADDTYTPRGFIDEDADGRLRPCLHCKPHLAPDALARQRDAWRGDDIR